MNKHCKRVFSGISAIIILFITLTGLAYASSGTLIATMSNGGLYDAALSHDYSNSRYCELSISQGSSLSSSTTIGFTSGTLSPNAEMHLIRNVTAEKGYSLGDVYFGQTPNSVVVWSKRTEDANPNYP